jgi:hypothetical protein
MGAAPTLPGRRKSSTIFLIVNDIDQDDKQIWWEPGWFLPLCQDETVRLTVTSGPFAGLIHSSMLGCSQNTKKTAA